MSGTNRIRISHIQTFIIRTLALLFILWGVATVAPPADLHAEESSCVECHTSTPELLKILRQIEATQPKAPAKSTESTGEG